MHLSRVGPMLQHSAPSGSRWWPAPAGCWPRRAAGTCTSPASAWCTATCTC